MNKHSTSSLTIFAHCVDLLFSGFKMALGAGGRLITLAGVLQQKISSSYSLLCPLTQVRNYAARKGTRERARKKKVKKEVVKKVFIPENKRVKKAEIIPFNLIYTEDSKKKESIDDVWFESIYRRKIYSFNEAVECHRDTHHPSRYDAPNGFIEAFIEINMQSERPTKLMEKFSRSVYMPHIFDHGEKRNVIAFVKTEEIKNLARNAGAEVVGGKEIITKIQTGEISANDFTAAVAHPEIMVDLTVVRGLLKRKFPNPRNGTLGLDLADMIKKILHGINYTVNPYERQPQLGIITAPIGTLSMDTKQLEENFIALVKDVESVRPKREGDFVFRTSLKSPPTTESLKINFEQYLVDVKPNNAEDSDEEDEAVISNTV
ncbi:Similar to Mrpl1: 39S ribosomal protein L1 [Cotesia congregata]|uniref:Mitochondrial (Mus musculus) n=1 Tax=Cotesia congregata TaxID=51543 RepID=A0A8J2H9C4_COTCN|nr:Similar to Mrpl1: 39S ribosomal protein L1 [Cotesia congregata]